jgi:hypothetical protein
MTTDKSKQIKNYLGVISMSAATEQILEQLKALTLLVVW